MYMGDVATGKYINVNGEYVGGVLYVVKVVVY